MGQLRLGYPKEIMELITRETQGPVEELEAAMFLISRFEKLCIDFAKKDKNGLLKELGGLTGTNKIDELEGDDLERACELTSELSDIEQIERKIKSDTLTLIAVNYLIKGTSGDKIREELKEETWFFRHEILTRWNWLSAQKRAIQKGRSFNRPYLCEVGPRDRRQNIDREFFTYLEFMPHYQARFQKGYLLHEYSGETHTSPDFISANEEGEQIGVEVTEATESEVDSFEAKQKERLMNELVKEFKDCQCHFTIWSRPAWSLLLDNLNELKLWLKRICEGNEKPTRHHRKDKYFHPDLDFMLSFKPESMGYLFTDISGDGDGNGYEGNEIEYRTERAVLKRISEKLSGPPPSVKPCLLVIYDNAQLPTADYKKIVGIASDESDTDFQTHFEGIWLLDDQQCTQLK